jgi:hypothetical protein
VKNEQAPVLQMVNKDILRCSKVCHRNTTKSESLVHVFVDECIDAMETVASSSAVGPSRRQSYGQGTTGPKTPAYSH